MSTTWGYGPVQFEVAGGADHLVKLRVPHRGEIYSINLEQIGGADAGSFEIFDSYNAARVLAESPLDSEESIGSEDVLGGDPPVHSVTQGPVAFTGGHYQAKDLGFKYRNRDGSYSLPKRELWMVLNSTGAGTKTFSLAMMIDPVSLSSSFALFEST